ncbi:MAG: hypothetical protein IH991_19275, partial [Planctomycetes bacterium]|nr:hypothetical protein [Planctomycetota bacterium]
MLHPLQQQVQAIARRARRLTIAHGVGCVIALCVAAGFLFGLSDYLIHYQDLGIRVICSATLLVVLVYSCYFFLLPALRFRRNDIEVAQRIERRFPELEGRLSTSLAFLQQEEHDALAGSAELRRAVVAQTSAVLDRVRTSEVLESKISLRAVLVAVIVCEIVAGFCWFDVNGASVAAERLAVPWTSTGWNDLTFVSPPDKVASETDVEFTLIDNNRRLPDSVTFQYRLNGDHRMREKEMKQSGRRMFVRIQNVARTFQFRAVGGDDETAWRTVQVRKPATITRLEVHLTPPEYTGLPQETTSGHIRAIHGTQIKITGACDQPLKSAELTFKHAAGVRRITVRLSTNRKQFSIPADTSQPWIVNKSGSYSLKLVDQHDVPSGQNRSWEIRAIADRPPAVVLEARKANLYVTPTAIVPIQATVSDDMAIHEIYVHSVHYQKTQNEFQDGEGYEVKLFAGIARPGATDEDSNRAPHD